MVGTYFPFATGSGASSGQDRWVKMAKLWAPTGVNLSTGLTSLKVFADSTGMWVKVPSGTAWVDGHYFELESEQLIPIGDNNSGLSRIDRVVLNADRSINRVSVVVLQGVASASPVAPALTQNSTFWQMPLAQVLVANGVTTISASNVTDERPISGGIDNNTAGDCLIYDSTLSTDTASITISDLPQTFTALKFLCHIRADAINQGHSVYVRPNNDTSSIYYLQFTDINLTTTTNIGSTPVGTAVLAKVCGAGSPAGAYSLVETIIHGYSDTNKFTTMLGRSEYSASGSLFTNFVNSEYRSTNRVNSLVLSFPSSAKFVAGSKIRLYGIR